MLTCCGQQDSLQASCSTLALTHQWWSSQLTVVLTKCSIKLLFLNRFLLVKQLFCEQLYTVVVTHKSAECSNKAVVRDACLGQSKQYICYTVMHLWYKWSSTTIMWQRSEIWLVLSTPQQWNTQFETLKLPDHFLFCCSLGMRLSTVWAWLLVFVFNCSIIPGLKIVVYHCSKCDIDAAVDSYEDVFLTYCVQC